MMTGISQVVFPKQANGSLIKAGDKVIGSEIIGQPFIKPEYFHPRPSAAGSGYDATASGGSNFGATNQKLYDRVKASIEQFRKENPDYHGPIPADLLTASSSGLDPHLSPDSARAQIARVARARGITEAQLNQLVTGFIEQPDLGILGEPRVNVLKLNLALDQQFPRK
jgi:K+-transporting ATPase ATPase C chain